MNTEHPDFDVLNYGGFHADPNFIKDSNASYRRPEYHPGFAPSRRERKAAEIQILQAAPFTESRQSLSIAGSQSPQVERIQA